MKRYFTRKNLIWLCVAMMLCCLASQPDVCYAATGLTAVQNKFDNFESIVTTFISGIGTIVALWCVAEIGGSWMGHGNGTAQFEAFKRMGGAILWIAAPQLITLF